MGTFDINETIKRYLIAYNGSSEGVRKRAKEDLRERYKTATDKELEETFRKAFYGMVDSGLIEPMPCEIMNEKQKELYENGDQIYQEKK